MDGWMDRWKDGRMDGRMDTQALAERSKTETGIQTDRKVRQGAREVGIIRQAAGIQADR